MIISLPSIITSLKESRNYLLPLSIFALFLGCNSETNRSESQTTEPNVVEITAVGLSFEAPDTIPSGWTTFRLNNTSEMIHFALLQNIPDGKGLTDHQEEVAPVFQNIMDSINGRDPSAPEVGSQPPEWYSQVQITGGPGFISPGGTAETTVFIEPGTYLLECYVKTNGIFHSYNPSPDVYGMVVELTVTEDSTTAEAPEPTLNIHISSEEGIQMEGTATSGDHIVEVTFDDQNVYENFVGHDVHLVRISENTDLEELEAWMNWLTPTGLQTPAPAEFIGGTNDMAGGSTAYIHVELEPGNYAWIAEVPNPSEKGMLQTFTVEPE